MMNPCSRIESIRLTLSSIVLLLALTLTGCDASEIKVYQVAKEGLAAPPAAQGSMPAGHPEIGGGSPAQPELTWKTPAGWQEMPLGQMRVASFKISGDGSKTADVSVIPLGGGASGDA